jgi:hypothetical protein
MAFVTVAQIAAWDKLLSMNRRAWLSSLQQGGAERAFFIGKPRGARGRVPQELHGQKPKSSASGALQTRQVHTHSTLYHFGSTRQPA